MDLFTLKNVIFKDIINIEHLKISSGVTCLIGASGSGKTTLLKLLNQLYSPDKGTIYYQGKDLLEMDSVLLRRHVIMLGQNPVLYQGDIEANLQIGLRFSQRPLADEDQMKAVLKMVKLDKQLHESCAVLSGGEKQRLCLARVMLMDGDVYLLDEPSSALDKESEAFIMQCLADFVNERNKSMIMVTHSEQVVSLLDAHKIRIAKGRCEVLT